MGFWFGRFMARGGVCALALGSAALLPGCVMFYSDYPRPSAQAVAAPAEAPLHYRVNRLPPFAWGKDPLPQALGDASGFAPVTRVEKDAAPPPSGTFVDIQLTYKYPSVPAAVSGYVSLATLTLWPTVSTHDGYRVEYILHRNGAEQGRYQYEITRKGAVWLPLALFSWVNLMRPGETDAFADTARQFVADARADGLL